MTPEAGQRQRLFIASSSEGLPVAKAVQLQLERDAEVAVWTDGLVRPTEIVWESLERELDAADCGLFVLAPDDLVSTRGEEVSAPRDNVILELGLFGGRLGRRRAVALVPRNKGVKIPSDLLGIIPLDYEHPEDETMLEVRLAPACTRLRAHLKILSEQPRYLSWEQTCKLTKRLAQLLKRAPKTNGFRFDAIVGLSRGGIVVADLLSRSYGGIVPVFCLWSDWDSDSDEWSFAPSSNWVNRYLLEALSDSRITKILLVDDAARRGVTLARAKDALVQSVPGKTVRTAALLAPSTLEVPIDYIAETTSRRLTTPFKMMDE